MEKIVKQFVAAIEKAEGGDLVAVISTGTLDRDGDIIEPKGLVLSEDFKGNPVVQWAHDGHIPAIGKALWVKATDKDVRAKIRWAKTAFAQEIKSLYDGGFLNAFSVGFKPLEYEEMSTGYRFTKWELWEFSACNVPANPEALAVRAKSLSADVRRALGVTEKKVIPYKRTPLADEGAAWDAAAEIRAADTSDLKAMCTWYDAENPDVKGAYKLPHHKAAGEHACIWRGVAAAMGALLGARGGVAIPAADKRGVYAHLAKHYSDFDKEPPEFRDYSVGELVDLHMEEKVLLSWKWLEMLGGREKAAPETSGAEYGLETVKRAIDGAFEAREKRVALEAAFAKLKGTD